MDILVREKKLNVRPNVFVVCQTQRFSDDFFVALDIFPDYSLSQLGVGFPFQHLLAMSSESSLETRRIRDYRLRYRV